MADQQAKRKTTKQQKTAKYARQFLKTAKNKRTARTRHMAEHPADKEAQSIWLASPIKTSK